MHREEDKTDIKHAIQKEWQTEIQTLKWANQYLNLKKIQSWEIIKEVLSGHAEVEGSKNLFVYGNALEVLARKEF